MDQLDERFLIYSAVIILCATAGVFLGLGVAVWSFIQIAAVIELTYWIGSAKAEKSDNHWTA